MKKWLKRMILTVIILVAIIAIAVYIYIQQPKFGQLPEGERLTKIQQSSHYFDNKFENLVPTEVVTSKGGTAGAGIKFVFRDRSLVTPAEPIPTIKTDLKALDPAQNTIIWLGHSTYFIRLEGKTMLIDPVFSVDAAPIPYVNEAFAGTSIYSADDMPEIDYVLISHDHWDHLDYPSMKALQPKVKQVITGLGVGAHLERFGYPASMIDEKDWYGEKIDGDMIISFLPAQHFSGRLFDRDKTLWGGFAIVTPKHRLFFSGYSGYGSHFKQIGECFGYFDLVMLDMGQYNENWPSVHMNPEQAAQAAEDLNSKNLLPGHIGKFSLAYHSWDEPFKRIYAISQHKSYQLLSPMIGQPLNLDEDKPMFEPWWQTLE